MGVIVKAGVGLALLVTVLSLVLAWTGLHESSPMGAQYAFIVPAILIVFVCVFWGLKQTATENGYGRQLMTGSLIGGIGAALILLTSLLMLTLVFPDYLDESKRALVAWIESSGIPESMKQGQIDSVEGTTAWSQSLSGFVATGITSVIASAIIGIFLRKR